jgi:hypothetical protein
MQIRIRRFLLSFGVAVAALALLATPADARRKFGSFSSGKSSAASPAPRAPAAGKTRKILKAALIGAAILRATRSDMKIVYELPESEETRLADGRYFDIGVLKRGFSRAKFVGYVSATEYLELPSDVFEELIASVGFDSVAAFEAHIAANPLPADEAEPAPADASRGPLATAALGIGSLGLLGLLGYFFVAWRRNAAVAPQNNTPVAARATRVVTQGNPALQTPPLAPTPRAAQAPQRSTVPRAAVLASPVQRTDVATPAPARRAPRDLSALTRKPQPA